MKKNSKVLSKKIDTKLISKLFHSKVSDINKNCGNIIKKYNLKYIEINSNEKLEIYKECVYYINKDNQKIAAKYRKKVWERGWGENLKDFIKNKSIKNLIPKYYTKKNLGIFRLGGKLIKSSNKNFEVKILDIYRTWFFKKFFQKVDNIYEFGCGSGNNLFSASKIFTKKNIFGLDFVKTSVKLINLVGKKKNLKGFLFDMNKKNINFKINNNSGFFSVGALEQLNNNIDNILNFFLIKKPIFCLNIEPDLYFYKSSIADKIAKKFQSKRGYTSNLIKKLKKLEREKKIKIIKIFRAPFGSLYIEGYNFILWKVL